MTDFHNVTKRQSFKKIIFYMTIPWSWCIFNNNIGTMKTKMSADFTMLLSSSVYCHSKTWLFMVSCLTSLGGTS